jgi:hypothetical protein
MPRGHTGCIKGLVKEAAEDNEIRRRLQKTMR